MLIINILFLFIGGIICGVTNVNDSIYFCGRLLEAIGAAGSQVGAYTYICKFKPFHIKKTLTIIKSLMALSPVILPFVGLHYFKTSGINVIHQLIATYAFFILSCSILLKSEDGNPFKNKDILLIYAGYFKLLKSKIFCYFSFCIICSQLLMFNFSSHPLVYFFTLENEMDYPYLLLFIMVVATFGCYYILYLKEINIINANLAASFAYLGSYFILLAAVEYNSDLLLFVAMMIISCASLAMITSNMMGIVLLSYEYSACYITWVGVFEAMISGVCSIYLCDYMNISLKSYAALLFVGGLILLAMSEYFNKYFND